MAARTTPIAPQAAPARPRAAAGARGRARRLARALARGAASIDRGTAVRVLVTAVVLSVAASLLFPATAHAGLTEAITNAIRGSLGWVFDNIMAKLVGGVPGKLTRELVGWLVAIPNFSPDAQQPYVTGPQRSHLDGARQATTMLALGGLAAVMTLSVLRYWLSGLSMRGSGGIEAFEGLLRTLLAVGLILLWPEGFRLLVALVNSATDMLMNWPSVKEDVNGMWGWVVTLTAPGTSVVAGPAGPLIGLMVAIFLAVMLIALVVMKIMLTAATAVLYVFMPIAFVLMPLPETQWVVRTAGRAFFVCLLTPLGWTAIFITFAALGADMFTLTGQEGALNAVIIKPLVLISMLGLAAMLPRMLGKAALGGAVSGATGGPATRGGGAGFISHTGSSFAARRLDGMLAQNIPQRFGGRMQPPTPAPTLSPAAAAGMTAAGVNVGGVAAAAGGPAAGAAAGAAGAARGAGAAAGAAGGPAAAGATRPPAGAAQGPGAAGGPQAGPAAGKATRPSLSDGDIPLHVPPKGAMQQVRNDVNTWRAHDGGPSEAATWGALGELSIADQERVAQEAGTLGPAQFRDTMLERSTNPGFTEAQQGAWFTLGAAGPAMVRDVAAFEDDGGFNTLTAAEQTDAEPWIPPHSDRGIPAPVPQPASSSGSPQPAPAPTPAPQPAPGPPGGTEGT